MTKIAKAVIFKNEKLLLIKRTPETTAFPSVWDFPGGKFEAGEDATQAMVREAKEEVGLEIEPGQQVKTAEYHSQNYDLLFHYFKPEQFFGNIELSDEHTEYGWFSEEEIKQMQLSPSVTQYLCN
jgi:8-oxo-dGTP diphosphatase